MVQRQALREKLQRHTRHDPRRDRKHTPIHPLPRRRFLVARDLEPQRRHPGAKRLTHSAQEGRPEHGLGAGADGEVEGEGHGETFGDVVDEEGHEDGEAEVGVCMVGGEGDEAFGEFVQGDGDGGLETNAEEGVCGDMMMVLMLGVGGGAGAVGLGRLADSVPVFEVRGGVVWVSGRERYTGCRGSD